jgi:hypothetical protein
VVDFFKANGKPVRSNSNKPFAIWASDRYTGSSEGLIAFISFAAYHDTWAEGQAVVAIIADLIERLFDSLSSFTSLWLRVRIGY